MFAIVITMLVLDIGVPAGLTDRSLADAVAETSPELAAWVVSFLLTGMYWLWHRDLFNQVRVVDRGAVWFRLVLDHVLLNQCSGLIQGLETTVAHESHRPQNLPAHHAASVAPALLPATASHRPPVGRHPFRVNSVWRCGSSRGDAGTVRGHRPGVVPAVIWCRGACARFSRWGGCRVRFRGGLCRVR